jgi:alcohol dehydrogenase (cytochrome c)
VLNVTKIFLHMTRPARSRILSALLAGAWLCVATNGVRAAEPVNPFAGDPTAASAAAAAGEELFGRNCQQCHNSRGKGGKAPQLVRGAWAPGGANSDAFMYRTITLGRPKTQMGSFALILEADEIWQVICFLRAEAQRVNAAARTNTDDDSNW